MVTENRKSQGKCVLAFGVPAITLFNDYLVAFTIAYVPQIGDFVSPVRGTLKIFLLVPHL